MAEIARDANMSTGNLYHYFESKLDIGEALCRDACDQIYEALRTEVRKPGPSATERLRQFLIGELRLTYERLDTLPRMVEMAEDIIQQRPQVRESQLRKSRSLIAEILAQGIASQAFQVTDVVETARALQTATTKYRYPQLFSAQVLSELEAELDQMIDLLIHGLTAESEQLSKSLSDSLEEPQSVAQ